jgi:hypothetical protein
MLDQAQELAASGNLDHAKILEQMRNKERQAKRWKRIHFLQGNNLKGQFSQVEVPTTWPSTEDEFLQNDIENPRTCTDWKTIDDPSEMEFYLQMRNRRHFGQAHGTPFTVSPLSQDINWSATSPDSEKILSGEYSPDCDDLLDGLIQSFQCKDDNAPIIPPELSLKELTSRIKIWDERTTTSPSGLHLGHLKALTARVPRTTDDEDLSPPVDIQQSLCQAQLDLINYSLKHGYSYDRWKEVVNVMIEKDPGNHRVHRLRVIHLYEADLGACYAILWKKLFAQAERRHEINPGQYGGRQGHEAAYLPYAEELKYEICRMSRKSLINFDNDAQSCFDRIIPSVASLIARSLGMHPNITKMHATTLEAARFKLKTSLGVSDSSYSHSDDFPIYGTGQGSTNSPIIWSMISSKLFDLHESKAHGASFCTPDRQLQVQKSISGFVDDSNCQTNDFDATPQPDPDELVYLATMDAEIWSTELYDSGGLLELLKCSYHYIYFQFRSNGKPYMVKGNVGQAIKIPDAVTGTPIPIPRKSVEEEHKTLGHYKAPCGKLPQQRQVLMQEANRMAQMVLGSYLTSIESNMVYFAVFLPKFSYVLPQCYFSSNQLRLIENKAQQAFTAKAGYNRKMSLAIRYGPQMLGGAGFVQLATIQGEGQVMNFLKHWKWKTYVSSLLHCSLAWAQMNAGISAPIMSLPSWFFPTSNRCFFKVPETFWLRLMAKLKWMNPSYLRSNGNRTNS